MKKAKPQARPGAALRALRQRNGWTLATVSERTGLPVSTLSKIENDKMALTFDKLVRLSQGLEVDFSRLLAGETDFEAPQQALTGRRSIVRAGDGQAIETKNYNHLYPASDLLNKRFIPIIAEVKAKTLEEFGEMIRHPGEEYAFVIEGEVDLYTDLYARLRLKAGDSIYFDSGMGHAYVNAGHGRCRVLSVCSANRAELGAAIGLPIAHEEEATAAPHKVKHRKARG